MDCKTARDIILTDYLDDGMPANQPAELAAHLATCAACRTFASQAREELLLPFDKLPRLEPPEAIWQAVRQGISSRPSPAANLLSRLRTLLLAPRPLLALGSVTMLLLSALFLTHVGTHPQPFDPEAQLDYLGYLLETNNPPNVDETGGYSSPIEEYFL